MIRVGPAGWNYKDWAGIVYPRPRPRGFDELAFIASYFPVIEINSSFYGPPTRKTTRSWISRVKDNPDFRFTGKVWQRFTHQRKTAWTRQDVRDVRSGFDPLLQAGRLGCILFQFPWSFKAGETEWEWLRDVLAEFDHYPRVVEVRHTSWLESELLSYLADEGVGIVNIDQPTYARSIGPEARVTSEIAYVRLHGRNYAQWWRNKAPHERYDYLYPERELTPWAARVERMAEEDDTKEVVAITNNHYRGKGVVNALMLRSMVEDETVAAPPPLFQEYGDALKGFATPRPTPEGPGS